MVNVYFGCSMRGGHPNVKFAFIQKIANEIESLGHELQSHHVITNGMVDDEKKRKETFIHDRDYRWMIHAQAGIFEISNPSTGTGAEIADMVSLGKPVLCLLQRDLKNEVSAYVQGKHGSKYVNVPFEVYEYHTLGEAKYAIKKFLERNFR